MLLGKLFDFYKSQIINKFTLEQSLKDIKNELRDYFELSVENLQTSHNAYRVKTLQAYGHGLSEDETKIKIIPEIDIESLKTLQKNISKFPFEHNRDFSKAIFALISISQKINDTRERCVNHFNNYSEESASEYWSLFEYQCKHLYLISRLKEETDRFNYTEDSDEEIVKKVTKAYGLPYGHEIIKLHLTNQLKDT